MSLEEEVDISVDNIDIEVLEEFVPKPGTKSDLWAYFGLKKDSSGKAIDDGSVYCKLCRSRVLAKSGNTSNLRAHLKNHHKAVHSQLQQPTKNTTGSTSTAKQPSIASSFAQSQPYPRQSKRYQELNEAVAYFICKDGLPLYTVEKEGFLAMIKMFDKRYEPPSRVHFSRSIVPDLYASTKEKVAQKLASGMEFFASTTDMWSSIGLTPYMSFTIHYINEDWGLESLALAASFLPKDHTADVLVDALEEVMSEWHLNASNLVCLTTDSGSNIVSAAKKLKWNRVSCFGHNLDLAITKALKDRRCDRALTLARKVVSAFSCSWKRRRELLKAQINLNIPQHSLVTDCQTRWGSMQKMVERVIEQEKAIRVVLSADRKASHLVLTWQDLDVLNAIQDALSPLAEFTDVMSGEKYVTISAVLPIVHLLKSSVLKEIPTDKSLTNELRATILTDLSQRNQDPDVVRLLQVSSFLDPRFKEKYISDEDELECIKDKIVFEAIMSLNCTNQSTESRQQSHSEPGNPPPAKRAKRSLGSLLKSGNTTDISGDSPTANLTPEQKIKTEIDVYTREKKLDLEGNPLHWWKSHESLYPTMARVAKKYLCAPATSTSSERVFSKGGRIVTPFRASLKPDTVEMLIFLSMNL